MDVNVHVSEGSPLVIEQRLTGGHVFITDV